MKACERCSDRLAPARKRYCKQCEKAVLANLRSAGYLTRSPRFAGEWSGANRPKDAQENTYETKHGRDG